MLVPCSLAAPNISFILPNTNSTILLLEFLNLSHLSNANNPINAFIILETSKSIKAFFKAEYPDLIISASELHAEEIAEPILLMIFANLSPAFEKMFDAPLNIASALPNGLAKVFNLENIPANAEPIALRTLLIAAPICSNLFDDNTNFSIAFTKVKTFPVTSDKVVANDTSPLLSPNLENPRKISFITNTTIRPNVTIMLNTLEIVLPIW